MGRYCKVVYTDTHPPTCPGIQSEDTIYTRVYSVFVLAFIARTNLCITHLKWEHFFTHLWTPLARSKRGYHPYSPTSILWKSEDSAPGHKARTEILTSLCQNVLTLNVKNWFWSLLWMPGRTPTCLWLQSGTSLFYTCLHTMQMGTSRWPVMTSVDPSWPVNYQRVQTFYRATGDITPYSPNGEL